ncbi:MAG: DNA (cytosine-5-)-methyltransferase, partial [Ignavibacteriales bacterium]|nr:DNA (cytosine-5-)-methyltransferase [Ignavibacteriales bacterium]
DWRVWEGDVRDFDWRDIEDDVDLLAGGPPCQPFSMGGKHRAHDDDRDMFPATFDVVRTLRPKAVLIENVKGLARASFADYFDYILLRLEFPELTLDEGESRVDHLTRLREVKATGDKRNLGLTYDVAATLVNAADYGVPQRRERVFFVGFRSDLEASWRFPAPTNSRDELLRAKWKTGEYWEEHRVPKKRRPEIPKRLRGKIERLADELPFPITRRWRTVRDAFVDLPDPRRPAAKRFLNHRWQPGAKSYPGHTGSPLDEPAKTLKAGDHGVPGGENMAALANGELRYFSVREAARLQTFPDGYAFVGSWTETMRQLGNAVPVALARVAAASIAESLAEAAFRKTAIAAEPELRSVP